MMHFYTISIMYLLAVVFILLLLEPSPDSGPWGLIKLAFLWPFVTVWMILQEIFPSEEE